MSTTGPSTSDLSTFTTTPYTMSDIPAQFTGQAAMEQQNPDKFDLKTYSYTPRDFNEDDVIVKIECTGICGSDLHTITGGWAKHKNYPAIVGHEIIGKVVKAGKNTTHSIGDRVGFGAQCGSCRKCENCQNQQENYCLTKNTGTYQSSTGSSVQPFTQGGYADYYQGPGHFAIRIPEELDSATAAPMLCAGVTVYAPLKKYGVGPGKKVGVIGIGGLGHLGVQFAAALGGDVYAISHSDRKREDSAKLGAKGFISTHDPKAVLKEHKATFDIILCTSFQDGMPLQKLYLPLVKPGGNLIIVGIPNSGIPSGGLAMMGKSITGSMIGSPAELEEMFKLAVEKNVRTWVEKRPMGEATKAVQDMHEGKARFRYVLMN